MEQIKNNRIEELYTFSNRLLEEKNGNALIDEYNLLLNSVTPEEVLYIFNRMSLEENTYKEIRKKINKISNIFYKPLCNYSWHIEYNTLLHKLMHENGIAGSVMEKIKNLVKIMYSTKSYGITHLKKFVPLIGKLNQYTSHYKTLTLSLYPLIVQHRPGLKHFFQIQEQFHAELKNSILSLENALTYPKPNIEIINKRIGTLSFSLFLMIFREEKVIFPFASQIIKSLH